MYVVNKLKQKHRGYLSGELRYIPSTRGSLNPFQTLGKIVIRRLPPDMTSDNFKFQVSPLPPYNYFYFVKADKQYGRHAFSRAYINFIQEENIFSFKEKFDGYVFLAAKGNEYKAVVEFAPFSKIPKDRLSKRKDIKSGTIESSFYYRQFLGALANEDSVKSCADISEINKSLITKQCDVETTPLLRYIAQKKQEKAKTNEDVWRTNNKKYYKDNCGSSVFVNSSRRNTKRYF